MVKQEDVHKDYFEGTIQLRNASKELVDFVKQLIEKTPDVWIVKETKIKSGLDMRISSLKFLRRLPEKIKQRFFGISKMSSTLFSRNKQTGKNIYRGTVMFRQASFKRGAVFVVRGVEMQVQSISDKVQLREKENGKKHLMDFDEVEEAYEHFISK